MFNTLDFRSVGFSFYYDAELVVDEYSGHKKIYHCGNRLVKPEVKEEIPFLLVVFDMHEASIGTYGESISILWNDTSNVPNKHGMGGQSQNRFQRGRDEAVKRWMKKVAREINHFHRGRDIIIGTCGVNFSLLEEHLSKEAKGKVVDVRNIDYTSENGLWGLVGEMRFT